MDLVNSKHCHEGVWESGCIDPYFLDSALVGGEWSASSSGRFTPWKRAPRYPFDRLGEPQNLSGQRRRK
jgi:hypothetical protein